jgi:hypothetical protein
MAESLEKNMALNPDAPAFDMAAMNAAAMAAANTVLARDARFPDFSMDKPEVWFSMVEAMFEDCNVTASKKKHNVRRTPSSQRIPVWPKIFNAKLSQYFYFILFKITMGIRLKQFRPT